MFIESINLTNFRNHRATAIEGLGRVNFFLGPNGAGKSTILDAIAYALTGVCRGVDEGGRGAEGLACKLEGITQAATRVVLQTDRGQVSRGLGQGPRSQAHGRIAATLGLDDRALRIISGPTNLLRLDRRKQQEVFIALAGGEVSLTAIEEALRSAGVTGDLSALAATLGSPDGQRDRLTYLKARRPEIKREIDALVYVAPKSAVAADEIKLRDLKRKRSEFQEAFFKFREQRAAAESAHSILTRRLDQERRAVAAFVVPFVDEKWDRTRAVELIESANRLSDSRADIKVKLTMFEDKMAEATREADAIKAVGPTCSKCRQAVDPKHSMKLLSELRSKYAGSKVVADLAQVDLDRINKELAAINAPEIEKQLANHDRARADLTAHVARKSEAAKRIASLENEIAALPTEFEDISPLEERIAELTPQIEALQQAEVEGGRRLHITSQRQKFEDELAQVEAQIKALAPGGPVAQLAMSDGVAEMIEEVRAIGERLGVGDIAVQMNPWSLQFNGRDVALASASEEFRIAAAFGIAFARRANVGIVLLDGADILRGDNRGLFESLVAKVGLEQIFIAASVDAHPEIPAGAAAWSVSQGATGADARRLVIQLVP